MLAIGRALMSAPRILLLDEPSLGLSPLIMQEVLAVIRQLRGQASPSSWLSRTCIMRFPLPTGLTS